MYINVYKTSTQGLSNLNNVQTQLKHGQELESWHRGVNKEEKI